MADTSLLDKIKEEVVDIKHEEVSYYLIKEENCQFEEEKENGIIHELKAEEGEQEIRNIREDIDEDKIIEFAYVKTEMELDYDRCEGENYTQEDPLTLSSAVKTTIEATEEDHILSTETYHNISQEIDNLCPTSLANVNQQKRSLILNENSDFPSGVEHQKTHLEVSSEEHPSKCSESDYLTSVPHRLTKQMKRQFKKKIHKCSQCNYSTSKASNLQSHKRIHSGEKPYKCSQCNYSTSKASNLQSHKRIHSGEKPCKCSQCNYSAAFKSSLNRHMKMHSEEKRGPGKKRGRKPKKQLPKTIVPRAIAPRLLTLDSIEQNNYVLQQRPLETTVPSPVLIFLSNSLPLL